MKILYSLPSTSVKPVDIRLSTGRFHVDVKGESDFSIALYKKTLADARTSVVTLYSVSKQCSFDLEVMSDGLVNLVPIANGSSSYARTTIKAFTLPKDTKIVQVNPNANVTVTVYKG